MKPEEIHVVRPELEPYHAFNVTFGKPGLDLAKVEIDKGGNSYGQEKMMQRESRDEEHGNQGEQL